MKKSHKATFATVYRKEKLSLFLQHPYGNTGADYKSKRRLSWSLDVLGEFKDDYWLRCEPTRNEAKVAGSEASLYRTKCTLTLGTVKSR